MQERSQLSLFAPGGGPDPGGPEAVVTPDQRALAARLPEGLYLGTSSWTFPGWAGIVYAGHPSKEKLVERGLEAYAKHPLLKMVGVDRSYYAPMSTEDWRGYARQVPPHFRTIAKAFSELTTPAFPNHPSYGERAGRLNSQFLDPKLALETVARAYLEGLGAIAGPLVLEIAPVPDHILQSEDVFLARLARLFAAMPRELPLAVELRTPRLLTPRYLDLLRTRDVGHVLNFWTGMPTPGEQAKLGADDSGGDLVFRLLLPPGGSYELLRTAYAPFDRLRHPAPALRADVVAIAKRALKKGRRVYISIGNQAEGSAPLTLFALAEAFVAEPM